MSTTTLPATPTTPPLILLPRLLTTIISTATPFSIPSTFPPTSSPPPGTKIILLSPLPVNWTHWTSPERVAVAVLAVLAGLIMLAVTGLVVRTDRRRKREVRRWEGGNVVDERDEEGEKSAGAKETWKLWILLGGKGGKNWMGARRRSRGRSRGRPTERSKGRTKSKTRTRGVSKPRGIAGFESIEPPTSIYGSHASNTNNVSSQRLSMPANSSGGGPVSSSRSVRAKRAAAGGGESREAGGRLRAQRTPLVRGETADAIVRAGVGAQRERGVDVDVGVGEGAGEAGLERGGRKGEGVRGEREVGRMHV